MYHDYGNQYAPTRTSLMDPCVVQTLTFTYLLTYLLTQRRQLYMPLYQRNTCCGRAFSVAGTTVWNSITHDLRNETGDIFQQSPKTPYFGQHLCAQRIRCVFMTTCSTSLCLTYLLTARKVAQWHSGKALDLQSIGCEFNSHQDKAA